MLTLAPSAVLSLAMVHWRMVLLGIVLLMFELLAVLSQTLSPVLSLAMVYWRTVLLGIVLLMMMLSALERLCIEGP